MPDSNLEEPAKESPAPVPPGATQAGEAEARRQRWAWAERHVWTDRMLRALEQGVKGGVWFSLIDKVWDPRNLHAAWLKVQANAGAAGVDHQSVAEFARDAERHLAQLADHLRQGTYRPQAVRRVWIPKPGSDQQRPLGIPTVRDRVVQGALRHVLEPIFERDFAPHSYGFRPGRGCPEALQRVEQLLEEGYRYVVDADLQSYFDTIPQDRLLEKVQKKVADGRVLELLAAYLGQGVLDGLERWTPAAGTPQGAVLSPLLANLYLDALDHRMAELGYAMVRYADDLVILCRTAEQAQAALAELQNWMAQAGLTLHPTKTRLVDAETEGFEFLGYRFERGYKFPRDKSLAKLKEAVRSKTRRCEGRSLPCIVADLNRTLKGWFGYFKDSDGNRFERLDRWIRTRFRSILRRRSRRPGRGRGSDHQRWPNAFFTALGLFSLKTAQVAYRQSPSG